MTNSFAHSRAFHSTNVAVTPQLDAPPSSQRWEIIRAQLRRGCDPCFGTEQRHFCDRRDCPYRRTCLSMRPLHRVLDPSGSVAIARGAVSRDRRSA